MTTYWLDGNSTSQWKGFAERLIIRKIYVACKTITISGLCLASVRFRVLSLVFFCYLPAFLYFFLILLKGPQFFRVFGIEESDGFLLSFFVSFPIVFAFVIAWQRLILKISCPSSSQAFLHPSSATKLWEMKAMILLYLFNAVRMYYVYWNSLSSLVSVSLSLVSLYAFLVESEVMFHMAKDGRVWHPFRRADSK